jgi:hypothetical protein
MTYLVIVPRRDSKTRPLFEKDAEVFRAMNLQTAINRAKYVARDTHLTRGHALVVKVVHHFRASQSIVVCDDMEAQDMPEQVENA